MLPALFAMICLSLVINTRVSAGLVADSVRISDGDSWGSDCEKRSNYRNPPDRLEFIKEAPKTAWRYTRQLAKPESMLNYGGLLLATGLLVAMDQPMLDATAKFGRRIGLTGNNKMKRAFSIAGQPIEVPHDIDTALYFVGDGWTHLLLAGSYLTYGLTKNDNRALHTASQIAEGMLAAGAITQILKHITGRESPFRATRSGGRWDFFPDQFEYHRHVPSYDAFPSGHLAVSMATLTVIAKNYPDQKWVRPLGYTLMSLLAFEMVNNGVHWISDYPLAIAIGYSVGTSIVRRPPKTDAGIKPAGSVLKHFAALPVINANVTGLKITIGF